MEQLEWIPMEPRFREEVRRKYTGPLLRSIFLFVFLALVLCLCLIRSAIADHSYTPFWLLVPFSFAGIILAPKVYRHKRYYFKDYKLGVLVKERVMITKVFDTPSGINIYWLSSEAIKSFVPDPYRIFRKGDVLFIYYLEHSKEYLAYEP